MATTWDPIGSGYYIDEKYINKEYDGTLAGLQQAINQERIRRGKAAWSFSTVAEGGKVSAAHIDELRAALEDIFASPGNCTTYSAPACSSNWTDSSLLSVLVKPTHVTELRTQVNNLEDDCLTYNGSYNTAYNTSYNTSYNTTYLTYYNTSVNEHASDPN